MRVGEVVGSYRITGKLGSGGMGAVYLAVHTLIGREAAIKVLLPEFCGNEAIVARFFNEAKATTAIRHPGIVEIYDFGYAEDGAAYLVMERLEGETLRTRLEREGRVGVDQALLVARQVAGALKAAHRLGVVHRDLKPDNVYIVSDPDIHGGERAKILDFGVAKLRNKEGFSENETAEGTIVGVPNYMAPEQCEGAEDVDGRADQYSLGCIMFEMLCGRPPFEGKVWADVMAQQVRMPPPRPSSLAPGLRPDVEELILKLLSKSPRDRFRDAHELIVRLHELSGLPPPAASGKLKVPLPEESPFESQLGLSSSINNSRAAIMSSARRTHALGKRDKPHGSQPPGFSPDETAAASPAAKAAKAHGEDELKMTTGGVPPPPKKPTLPPPFPPDSSRPSAQRAAVKPPTRPPPVPGKDTGPAGKAAVDPLGQTMRPDQLPLSAPTMAAPAPPPAAAPRNGAASGPSAAAPKAPPRPQRPSAPPPPRRAAGPTAPPPPGRAGHVSAPPPLAGGDMGRPTTPSSPPPPAPPQHPPHGRGVPSEVLPSSTEVPAPPSLHAYAPPGGAHADPHRSTTDAQPPHAQAPHAQAPHAQPPHAQPPHAYAGYPGGFAPGAAPRRRTGKLGAVVIGLALLGGGASAYFIATSSDLSDAGALADGDAGAGEDRAASADTDGGLVASASLDAGGGSATVALDAAAVPSGDGGSIAASGAMGDAGAAGSSASAEPIVDDETRRRPVALITITLESLPKGAKVIRATDKVRLGETPFTYQIEPQNGTISFILRHKGYQDEVVVMPANRSSSKKVPLLRSTGKDRAPTIHDE